MPGTSGESLGEYVARIMREKHLTMHEVEVRSSGGITDAYVGNIVNGKVKSPSIVKLAALAKGLEVSEYELFRVALGRSEGEMNSNGDAAVWSVYGFIRAMEKIASSPELTRVVQALLEMSAQDVETVLKLIESKQGSKSNGKQR